MLEFYFIRIGYPLFYSFWSYVVSWEDMQGLAAVLLALEAGLLYIHLLFFHGKISYVHNISTVVVRLVL